MVDRLSIVESAEFRQGGANPPPAMAGKAEAKIAVVRRDGGFATPKEECAPKAVTVAVFNVKYSANLGDGLIAESMEAGLSETGIRVKTYDLAGRTDYGEATIRNRGLALAVLHSLPPALRRIAVEAKLGPKLGALEPSWREAIRSAGHVVIGGGHLFQDGDLNFPLKVGAVLKIASEEGTPVSVHAVGVTRDWSAKGRALFHRLLDCEVGRITVRDAGSQESWARHFQGTRLENAMIVPDPVIGLSAETNPEPDHVALGVTAPRVLSYHAASGKRVLEFYPSVLRALAARGKTVTIFSNGATEDEQHIDALLAEKSLEPLISAGLVHRAAAPRHPHDLVSSIAPATVVIAHRLHANILAYALGKPSIGLAWDPKLDSFFQLTGRTDYLFGVGNLDPESVADAAQVAARDGLDGETRKRLQETARESLHALAGFIVNCSPKHEADR